MCQQSHRHPDGSFFAKCILVGSLFLLSSPALAEARPSVYVEFRFDGYIFEDDFFTPKERQEVADHALNKFIDIARRKRGFLGWTAKPPRPEVEAAAGWEITLKLEVQATPTDAGGPSEGWIVTLEHSWVVGSQRDTFSQPEEMKTIYPLGSTSIPLGQSDVLMSDISKHLENHLPDLFEMEKEKQNVVDRFANRIPIADKVIADDSIKAVIIPIKPGELGASPNTKFRIDLDYSPESTYAKGWLLLDAASTIRSGNEQYRGRIKGRVTEVTIDPVEVATLPTWWNPQFSDAIDSASSIRVYMSRYDPLLEGEAGASDGSVPLPMDETTTASDSQSMPTPPEGT